jgi:hypothetical protein
MQDLRQPPSMGRALCLAAAVAVLLPVDAVDAADRRPQAGRPDVASRPPGGPFGDIAQRLDAISAQLDALALYVPFKVQVPAGMCDSAAAPSSNPKIVIDSDGEGPFAVNSILVKRGPMNPVDFLFLSLNGVAIDGTFFETRTGNLFDPLFGEFAVQQSADILGMPVRRGGPISTAQPGGNVPHEIVADGEGAEDVVVRLFCRSDERDLTIETVLVAGWKRPGDTVAVTYVPDE